MNELFGGRLPVEVIELIFCQTASTLGLTHFIRLRLVSKGFSEYVDSTVVMAEIIDEKNLLRCRDRDLIHRFLTWRIKHDANHEGITNMKRAVKLFTTKSNDKYSFDKTLQLYLDLLIDIFMTRTIAIWGDNPRVLLWGIDHEKEIPDWYTSDEPYDERPRFNPDDMTCLSLACAFGDVPLIEQILAQDDVRLDEPQRPLPLGHPIQAAVRYGRQDVVRLLLDKNSAVQQDHMDEMSFNVLIDAILSNRLDMLSLLLDLDLQFKHSSAYHQVLMFACYADNIDAFNILLSKPEYSPTEQRHDRELLGVACLASSLRMARLLFTRNSALDPEPHLPSSFRRLGGGDFCTSLGRVAGAGNVELLQFLLDKGANPSNALTDAAAGGSVRCLRLLVKAGATYDRDKAAYGNNHPVLEAALGGHEKAVTFLLENRFSPMDEDGWRTQKWNEPRESNKGGVFTPTMDWQKHNHNPRDELEPCHACVVEALIRNGYDVETANSWAISTIMDASI